MTFADMDLEPRCLRVLHEQDIEKPTPVQEQAIPIAIEGKDLIATAQTGTGKTLGYVLPSVIKLAEEKALRNRMLVLVPTRELCLQVEKVVQPFAKALHMHSCVIYGGVGYGKQIDQLKRGCDIIVATPGRLLDHMGRGNVLFNDLEILIFDEADRMLDMGFLPDIRRILQKLPDKRQTLMFSATFAPELQRLADTMMHDPERVEIGQIAKPVEQVRQLLVPVRQEKKSRMLLDILEEEHIDSGIIFLGTKMRADRVAKMLKKTGHKAVAIHGDLNQKLRQQAIEGFRSGKYSLLVATDVAARGLDIDEVSHVINYDIPPNADDYVHRIGRTARAERDGDAITFVTPGDMSALSEIERTVGRNLPRKEYEDAPRVLSLYKPPGSPTAKRRSKGGTRVVKRGLRRGRR
jgi:ATP-dependent RNA helicase RhlE